MATHRVAVAACICAGGCSQQDSTLQPAPAIKAGPGHKAASNSDMAVRTHCSLMGYRVRLLAAFPEKLGDRTLYRLDCDKAKMDCDAVTMSLENSGSLLDFADVGTDSHHLVMRHPDRVTVEESHPSFPFLKKSIIIDVDQGTATYVVAGQTRENDWRVDVKCDEVLKSDPEIEGQLRERESEQGLSPRDPLVRPVPR